MDARTLRNIKSILRNVESLAISMKEKVDQEGGAYVQDLTYEVEDLCLELGLDMTFIPSEIAVLKKLGFKVSTSKFEAKKSINKIPVRVEKTNFDEYEVTVGKGFASVIFEIYTLEDLSTKNGYLKTELNNYKSNLKNVKK